LNLYDKWLSNFSASPTHYTSQGSVDVLDIAVHGNVPLSGVTASDHLPGFSHILDHVSARDISAPVETHKDLERFRSLASELISLRIHIHTTEEAEEAASTFAAFTASAFMMSTRKPTLSDLNNELPGIDHLQQLRQRLRKLWHETRDPACKTTLNWVTKTIRRMARMKVERWKIKKINNCDVTPRAVWLLAKSLTKRDRLKAPSLFIVL
jgi:hypothetical protein